MATTSPSFPSHNGRPINIGVTASLHGKIFTGAGWIVGWRMSTRALGLISTLVLARLLLPAAWAARREIAAAFGTKRRQDGSSMVISASPRWMPEEVIAVSPAGRIVVLAGLGLESGSI